MGLWPWLRGTGRSRGGQEVVELEFTMACAQARLPVLEDAHGHEDGLLDLLQLFRAHGAGEGTA